MRIKRSILILIISLIIGTLLMIIKTNDMAVDILSTPTIKN